MTSFALKQLNSPVVDNFKFDVRGLGLGSNSLGSTKFFLTVMSLLLEIVTLLMKNSAYATECKYYLAESTKHCIILCKIC